jgi:NAD(P)-dependent dehydrogenase (short-subunit alcohol dehydrogenase family)
MTAQTIDARRSTELEGRVCLVTGGATGIGLASAIAMAKAGASAVVIAGRRADRGEAAAQMVGEAGAEAWFVQTDVAEAAAVAGLVDGIMARFGRLDVAFNNAGYQELRAHLAEQSLETFETVVNINLRSVFLCMRAEIQAMQPRGGVIINTASVSGVRNPNWGVSLYAASKAAVISLTRSAAVEYGPHNIRINGIAPGRVVTEMTQRSGADMSAVAAGLPARRLGAPEEVAEAVVWLASDRASFVFGQVLCTDGGFLAG